MKKRTTSLVLAGVLGLGGLTTGLVVAPAVALAQSTDGSTADAVSERVSRIAAALAGLVSDGSITQAQADEVASTLADQLPRLGGPGHGHGPGGGFGRHLDAAADVLGVSEDELRTALESGQSLAQVAEAQGVERQALVDALVAEASQHIDEEVAEGDLTQAEADERKAELTERISDKVDQEGLPVRGHHGHGPSGDRSAEDSATS